MAVGEAEFEELVSVALDGIPEQLGRLMDNVVVLVEDEPPATDLGILGLYDGIPLTERDSGYTFAPRDRIFVYRGPLSRMCSTTEQLVREVRITVVHEVAHHFGIDDESLHDLGYA
jgi:predicted Zn-dependent protease with MMP-like domain